MDNYAERIRQQIEQFIDVNIHDLPDIFHYWSDKNLRPMIEAVFGRSKFADIYAAHAQRAFHATGDRTVVSLGAGDAWMEVDIAKSLVAAGEHNFSIVCVELSQHLIERGIQRARDEGVADFVTYQKADLNSWRPEKRCAAFMANQALHHFVDLEQIFDLVADNLEPAGRFMSNDMIGRNGHMRWPETRAVIDYFWKQLPESFKYHHQLRRFESPEFIDWDCSVEGFEGIRAQDILPLLLERFGFSHFAAWGGVIDIFLDRGFGHNYSNTNPEHRAFIDRLEEVSSSMLNAGFVKPTQMFAVMVLDKNARCISHRGMTPQKALRDPNVTHIYPAPLE
jgi:SAM-dependent methyltransferase